MAAKPVPADDPIDAIVAVIERAFDPRYGEAWNRRQVSDALLLGNCIYSLAGFDGTIGQQVPVGTAGFYLAREIAGEMELLLFAVVPEQRGRGIGQLLLLDMVRRAHATGVSRVFLEMRADNPAVRLYERHGFRSVGRRPAYYRGNDGLRRDAISYALVLP